VLAGQLPGEELKQTAGVRGCYQTCYRPPDTDRATDSTGTRRTWSNARKAGIVGFFCC